MNRRAALGQLLTETAVVGERELVRPGPRPGCDLDQHTFDAAEQVAGGDVQRMHQKNRRGTMMVSPALTGSVRPLIFTWVS